MFINTKSCLKVAECIYHHVFINGESRFKVAEYMYHRVKMLISSIEARTLNL